MTAMTHMHADCRYLVVGLGLTGFSVARYLLRNGYSCVVQDDRESPPYERELLDAHPSVLVIKTGLSEPLLDNVDCLVVSPGLSIRGEFMRQAAESGKRIIGDIELFAEAVGQPVLAITGSNGKSTVTSLLGEMIIADGRKAAVGGNLGLPALDLLDSEAELYVLELSSFQLETTFSLQPLAATVLNVSEDHMDRYDDFADYCRTKKRIYRHAQHCISNLDDELTRCGDTDIRFSIRDPGADYAVVELNGSWLAVAGEPWLDTRELRLRGRHNWANCLAAMALARTADISRDAIVAALRTYTGLPHRSQWVGEINGVNWINDSKATNPGAVRAAVEGIDEPVVLIAGGQGKGANMDSLCDILRNNVKTVLLFGEDATAMAASWSGCTQVEQVENLAQAVDRAHRIAVSGDVVLLSPACASFDQFSGYAERGDTFRELVGALT